ncbi:MAG: gfo/Idh/MocA family oxidoreductase [Calditrichaeota bacterium]|nr:MAG: gfo/Idh/MocA family oxidoreductase [Calditrichota bacterium]MBL1205210.1 gfo/Idh/MocA family oxidoreductase [Calditrichota bacterium]NOG45040.1 Gfo/Idh/MocA family oxidoreductase [Calditrichota bacterium]
MKKNEKSKTISRRDFLSTSALAVGAVTIVPRHVLGGPGFIPPSDKLNIACIGVGGKGRSDMAAMLGENVVAICDVDDTQYKSTEAGYVKQGIDTEVFSKAKRYKDFRVMLEKHNEIDAVTVSTPDHTHAVAAMAALNHGKHVFVQKPLTHTVFEARKLAETAREKGLITQMGNQGHATEEARLINEWIWDGAIGDVHEVHAWTNRPIWPQGIDKPDTVPSVPPTFDWNLWLGPAPWRTYHPAYAPFAWRGWWDFGVGALGDMGAHIMDHPYWALGLESPETIQASSTKFNDQSYPVSSMITYKFPERGSKPPIKFTWYDGGLMPLRPEELEPGRRMGEWGGGVLYYGEKGKLMHSVYGGNPRLIPETKMKEYKRPEKTIPRSPGIHEEWIAACKGNGKTTSNFDYASKLTETMLLGNVALRVKDKNTILDWDAENMRFTNLDEANQYLHKEYRKGWSL